MKRMMTQHNNTKVLLLILQIMHFCISPKLPIYPPGPNYVYNYFWSTQADYITMLFFIYVLLRRDRTSVSFVERCIC
jgi:hypothetical protein